MWFELQPCDQYYGERAPYLFHNAVTLDAHPHEVFAALADPDPWPTWFAEMRSVRYTTDPPHGVGSIRKVEAVGLTAIERFIAWEPGERFAFYLEKSTVPGLSHLMEDYQLTPVAGPRTRLDWFVYYRPRTVIRPIRRLLHPLLGRTLRKGAEGIGHWFASRAEARAAR